MRVESVAVLDVRSYEVTFFLGYKGVNDTFVFCGSHTEKYEGYSTEGFFDVDSFRRAVVASITSVRQNYEGVIGEIYVGVPSAFVSVKTKGHTASYRSKRKISSQDVSALYDSGLNELLASETCIRKSNMYFTLGDNQKYFHAKDLYGVPTSLLKGALCYYFIGDAFLQSTTGVLKDLGFDCVHFLPSTLAQALYLLPETRREGYAFLLDVGFLTTSISVVYGNGIVHGETFDFGEGAILVAIMNEFGVEYEVAQEILHTANISGGNVPKEYTWMGETSERVFSVQKINDVIKCSLDLLCEKVEEFFAKYYKEKSAAILTVNPISITGEGIGNICGATEHISRQLNRMTEIVVPDLPYYDKPNCSSRLALLNMAISDREKGGWFNKLKLTFGGRNK
jgi:cell division ATPase FtsA